MTTDEKARDEARESAVTLHAWAMKPRDSYADRERRFFDDGFNEGWAARGEHA